MNKKTLTEIGDVFKRERQLSQSSGEEEAEHDTSAEELNSLILRSGTHYSSIPERRDHSPPSSSGYLRPTQPIPNMPTDHPVAPPPIPPAPDDSGHSNSHQYQTVCRQ